jgi:putative inorganic carbon (hco3(-)) transporter
MRHDRSTVRRGPARLTSSSGPLSPTESPTPERTPLPTALLSLSIVAEIFSGNWKYIHVPLGGDRILFGLGVACLVFGGTAAVSKRKLRPRPIHALLLVTAVYALGSAIAAHTISQSTGQFALLDRLGFIPFVMFCLAPLLFGRAKQRNYLLAALVVIGAYLGVTAFLEGVGLTNLTFPAYIRNPNLGIHFGRARGPFLESAADGLSMYMCAVAAAVGLKVWTSRASRWACGAVILLCGFGVVFTLTRAVWIAAVVGTLVALLVSPRTRNLVAPAVILGSLAVLAVLFLVPGLSTKVQGRTEEQQPVWDRYNTNAAAIRMVEAKPVFGFGWQTFITKGVPYIRQSSSYPLTGFGIEVHNVFLSHAAELGLTGSVLWTLALFSAVGGAILRRGPPELAPWRVGLVAIFVAFLVVANLGPLSYPFPNLLLWTWAGIAGANHFLVPRGGDQETEDEAHDEGVDEGDDHAAYRDREAIAWSLS